MAGVRDVLHSPRLLGKACWCPVAPVITAFALAGIELVYSLYPDVMIDRMTIWQSACATEAIAVIAIGCAITVPTIAACTVL